MMKTRKQSKYKIAWFCLNLPDGTHYLVKLDNKERIPEWHSTKTLLKAILKKPMQPIREIIKQHRQKAPEAEKSIHREEPPNVFDQLFLEDSNTDDCFIDYDDLLNNPNENIF